MTSLLHTSRFLLRQTPTRISTTITSTSTPATSSSSSSFTQQPSYNTSHNLISSRTFSTSTRVRRYARQMLAKTQAVDEIAIDKHYWMTGIKPQFKYTKQQLQQRTYPLRKGWRRLGFLNLLKSASFVLVVDFGGSVDLMRKAELRKTYPALHFYESSNSIFRNAVQGTPYWGMAGLLAGQCSIIYAKNPATVVEDLVSVAECVEANTSWILYGGTVGESLVTAQDIDKIKSYGTTAGVVSSVIPQLQSPRHQLFRTLQSPNHLLFRVLQSKVKTLQGDSGTSPAPDASASASASSAPAS